MARKARKTRAPRIGAHMYSADGFVVEGRHFGQHLEHACAFAGALVREMGREVAVELVMLGMGRRSFLYVPADSIDAAVARRDAHGHVILC